jgi:hypothetical protein
MTNIKHPSNIDFVEPGDRQLSASGYNGLIQSARKVESFRRGITNSSDIKGNKDSTSIRYSVRGIAKEDIPEYSIFTIEEGGDPWTLEEPTPLFAKFVTSNESACVFLSNGDDKLFQDADYYLPVCDFFEPHIFKYDELDGVPVVGDRIGPKLDSFEMSLEGDNLSFTVISPPDEDEKLVWCIKACVGAGTNMPLFEFTEVLQPGYTGKARKLKWDPITKVYILDPGDTKEYILYDPEEQNMFLPGERVHGLRKQLKDSTGTLFAEYEIVGEHGLHRKVKVVGDVDCGEVGETTIWSVDPQFKQHPPVKYPDDPDCVLTSAGQEAALRVCNNYGYRRKILNDEFIDVDYDFGRQAWIFDQEDRGVLIEATLTQDMCPSDQEVTVSGAQLMDWKIAPGCNNDPTPSIDNVTNSKGLAGRVGDKIFGRHYEGKSGATEWHVDEVQHVAKSFFRELVGLQGGQGPCLQIYELEIAAMTCKDEDPGPTLGVWGNMIDAITFPDQQSQQQECDVVVGYREACVLALGDSSSLTYNMTEVDVIVDLSEDQPEPPEPPIPQDNCSWRFERDKICVFRSAPTDPIDIPLSVMNVVGDVDIKVSPECALEFDITKICVPRSMGSWIGKTVLPTANILSRVEWEHDPGSTGDPADDSCDLVFYTKEVCVLSKEDEVESGRLSYVYHKVGTGIQEGANDCTELTTKYIPVPDCDAPVGDPEIIFCVVDCEDTPTTVLTEANTAGTYTPTNKETQPYDPTAVNNDDIIIQFPPTPLEGEVIAIANNTMSETTVLVDGNGNNVQALSAPYTAATVSIGAPMLNVTYMARLIGGNIQWRIV